MLDALSPYIFPIVLIIISIYTLLQKLKGPVYPEIDTPWRITRENGQQRIVFSGSMFIVYGIMLGFVASRTYVILLSIVFIIFLIYMFKSEKPFGLSQLAPRFKLKKNTNKKDNN